MIFVLFITIIYTGLIVWLLIGINKVPKFHLRENKPETKFSIVIPFRNEAENLPDLLHSISQLTYDKKLFEILFVNDDSDDNSVQIIVDFFREYSDIDFALIDNIRRSNSPKKDAITTAIKQSNFDWILATDADCILPVKWLQIYNEFIIENKPVFIAGLVSFQERKGFLAQFQQLDWMSLVGVTIGSFGWQKPMLCSGANLGYSKQAFLEVNGFLGNDQIASGDDVFLLQKMQKKFPEQVFFLKNNKAMVKTKSESTWKALLQQRIRWAAKTGKISNLWVSTTGILVLLTNLLFLSLLISAIFKKEYLFFVAQFFVVKLFVDGVLLLITSKILQQKIQFSSWFLGSLFYPFFSVSVAFMSLFLGYNWKGRRFFK